MIDGSTTLGRRLERYRAATRPPPASLARVAVDDLATRLAEAVDGEVVRGSEGVIVRRETPSRSLPVDRRRLADLPGQPPPDVPLVCLDTETTGLATAAGTMAFLIGLGWWEADDFRQVQLLLPDHAEERALLSALEAAIPPSAWLVTYNGRGFDWPLLTTRFRMARRAAPAHTGHLDLLPIVRRLFRHRMADARLRTAEAELLGLHRIGDVDGWEIPGRYLRFLAGAPATELAEVVRHNDQDVRSLGRLMAYLEMRLGDPAVRAEAPPGDLAGLGRAFARERRLCEALDCLDAAIDRPVAPAPAPPQRSEQPLRAERSAWSRPA
ncbi:MAG TPA: ribonuclease H-like domain-containing protein, partial [Candidatus Limnocylindrales bacterium]